MIIEKNGGRGIKDLIKDSVLSFCLTNLLTYKRILERLSF